ncbi:hypothetical protein COK43_10360 [Bacillus cereus]|nr:hypothetical protein COK43_10360 [Bacillus cereus]PGQ80476.1 hypothetical protein COA15_19910 [Bacillus anthracis]
MNNYDKESLVHHLNGPTIAALSRFYGISYKQMAARLRCGASNVKYHIDGDSFAEWQRMTLLDLFMDYGLEVTELILINQLLKTKK